MLTIFNRRELITLTSQRGLFRVREALAAAGIGSYVKVRGLRAAAGRGRYGSFGLQQDALYTWTVYVHRDDHSRAAAAIQPALRGD